MSEAEDGVIADKAAEPGGTSSEIPGPPPATDGGDVAMKDGVEPGDSSSDPVAVAAAVSDAENGESEVKKSTIELVSTSPKTSPRAAKGGTEDTAGTTATSKGSRDVTPVSSFNKKDADDKKDKPHRGHHGGHHDNSVSKTQSAETSGGNSADAEKDREKEKADEERAERLRVIRQKVDDVLESTPVVIVMAILTVWALFSDDLRLAAAPPDADIAFTAIISIAFFLFAFEIVAASFAKDDYLYVPEQVNLPGETVFQSAKRRLEIGSFYFWLDIVATISLIFEIDWMDVSLDSGGASYGDDSAARAQRIVRIVRMVRLVRLVKLYKYSTNLRNKQVEEAKEKDEAAERAEKEDEMGAGEDTGTEGPKAKEGAGESRVGAAMTDLTNKRVVILVLIMLIVVPILDVQEVDLKPILALQFIHKAAVGHIAQADATFQNTLQLAIDTSKSHTDVVKLDFSINGVSGMLSSFETANKLDGLRDVEMIEIAATHGATGLTTTMIFDDSSNSRNVAAFSLYTTMFVVFLLITGTIVLSYDTDRLLIVPIERMVELVQKISANPLGVEYKMLGAEDGFVEGMETTTLLSTITKIGRLMRVGFGEAGADVIGRNMQGGMVGGKLNLLGKGQKIESIYGFCDVRQFTDTTECLQEEVMLFVNRIGHILHSIVVQCSGAANKNIGDAFLLTWKVETRYTPKQQTALADQALLCFCKALIELGRYQEFIINFSAASTARLYKRFPGYNVRIGSGLHKGWAIEGAIGSHRKIDASYLSPHVNFTEFLESSTKAYGTPLLISEPCYSMFSNTAKRYIRKVDSIRKSRNAAEPIIGLYTYDSDLSIDWADPNRKLIAKKLMPTLKAITGKFQAAARRASIGAAARLAMTPEQIAAEAEKKKEKSRLEEAEKAANDKKTKPPEIKIDRYREDVWRVDADLIDLRHRVNESFRKTFHEGIDFYIKGEWESAKAKFERCVNLSKNNGPPDGPSSFLLKFMEETNFVAPGDWEGYRIDGG